MSSDGIGDRKDDQASHADASPSEAWLVTNRDALLEMAAWDRKNEIFAPGQKLF